MNKNPLKTILSSLATRRKNLGMPIETLVRRSGVSRSTVSRILSGEWENATFANVLAIADALGLQVEFVLLAQDEEFREQQAREKARQLVNMVQGTSGLEAQAVDQNVVDRMIHKTTHELLAGSKRKLWS